MVAADMRRRTRLCRRKVMSGDSLFGRIEAILKLRVRALHRETAPLIDDQMSVLPRAVPCHGDSAIDRNMHRLVDLQQKQGIPVDSKRHPGLVERDPSKAATIICDLIAHQEHALNATAESYRV